MAQLTYIFPHFRRQLSALANWHRQTLGQSPSRWAALLQELIWFWAKYLHYRSLARRQPETIRIYPILFQRSAIPWDAHYAYQSAWATRRLIHATPAWHLDISSDLRFVMQLSAHFPVTYLEYRPPHIELPNLTVLHGSITRLPLADRSVASLSCLHVLEHIGLGRYGDPLDPQGYQRALAELARVLAPEGRLLVSVPVGRAATLFNAHRIFSPSYLPTLIPELVLEEFSAITTLGRFEENMPAADLAAEDYACGLYLFRRPGIT